MVESPPAVELPLEADLARLPKPAIVAYAVRNALRVLPLFVQMAFYCNRDEFQRYARELIKVSCLGRGAGSSPTLSTVSAKTAREAARVAAYAHAIAASRAAFAVSRAYAAADERIDATRAASYAAAFATTAFAAATAPTSADEEATRSMTARAAAKHDFDCLVKFCKTSTASTTGFDAGEHGPLGSLWPDGPPDWYTDALPKWQEALRNVGLDDSR